MARVAGKAQTLRIECHKPGPVGGGDGKADFDMNLNLITRLNIY